LLNQDKDKFENRLMFIWMPGDTAFGGRTLDNKTDISTNNTPLFDKSNCLYGLEHPSFIVSTGVASLSKATPIALWPTQRRRNVVATWAPV
jgi:hypothetical protein